MIADNNIIYDVWLSMALRSCCKRFWHNLDIYGSAEKIYNALKNNTLTGFDDRELEKMNQTDLSQAKSVIEHCKNKNYEIITYSDDIYPELLREIYDPPLVLYCYGRVELLKAQRMISMVGTRKPSAYSIDVAKNFCKAFVENKFVVISGFALGIDSVSHAFSLKSGGYSIAVIGCGLDYPYPKENFYSRENFIKHGLIISEFIPSAPPEAWCFPHRNRIISGMSMATVVVEASAKSGSLVTASLAAEQGRDVFCVPPHDIFDNAYGGNVKLLKSGAIPAFSYKDILEEYSIMDMSKIPLKPSKSQQSEENAPDALRSTVKPVKTKAENLKAVQKAPIAADENVKDSQTSDEDFENMLDEPSKMLVKLLKKRDMHVDELAFESGLDMAQLFLLLTELEISGFVESKAGNIYGVLR